MLLILLLGAIAPSSAFFETLFSSGIKCSSNQFPCKNSKCIDLKLRCNEDNDCGDSSDEMDCELYRCEKPQFFRCRNDRCVSYSFVCDGENDCHDFSDESDCSNYKFTINSTCQEGHWRCTDKLCIPNDWVCNGTPDCLDLSDETIGCSKDIECDSFKCKNKHCIPNEWLCDGNDDCHDNSDEEDCENHVPIDQCTLDKRKFLCSNNKTCIDLHLVCDGVFDCPDSSDEGKECNTSKITCRSHKCSHDCFPLPSGPSCLCPTGQYLKDGKNCEDINECEIYGICDQKCFNTNSSYECYCEDKYYLLNDKKTCKAHGGNGLLVFSSKDQIRGFTLDSTEYFTIAKNLKQVVGVAFDGQHIYWTEIAAGRESIVRSIEDGSEKEAVVTSGLGLPEDLAIDWLTKKIYFTDADKQHIGVCTYTGTVCTVLINKDIRKPRGIALNVDDGDMYWTDWGEPAQIGYALMDGTHDKPFVTTNIHWPNGLALDYPNRRLYWTDAKRMSLESISLDGTNRKVVLEGIVRHPYAIAVFENKLYWSDWATHTIQTCDKFDGKDHHTLQDATKEKIYGIHIFHYAMHKRNVNPCDAALCSDLCLLRGQSYSCACPHNKILDKGGHICREIEPPQMLIAAYGEFVIHIHHQFLGKHDATVLPSQVRDVGAIAYDSYNNSILISDLTTKKIISVSLDTGSTTTIELSGIGRISSMDYDAQSNNLYICDKFRAVVEVINLNTNGRKILIHDTSGEIPHSIALVPDEGVMFVSFGREFNGPSHIDRFLMDGTGRTHAVDSDLIGPVFLTYDPDLHRIFFVETSTGIIESTSVDGDDRHHFRTIKDHPISIAPLKDDLFWTNAHSNNLVWADKKSSSTYDNTITLDIKEEPEHIHLLSVTRRKPQPNACRLNNNGCSHICLMSHKSLICECPVGWELTKDNHTCARNIGCDYNKEFLCPHSNICILKSQRCNGNIDCHFGEDEKDCNQTKPACPRDKYQCKDGECIDIDLVCNHRYDCKDKSDEQECKDLKRKLGCPPDHFTCRSNDCVMQRFVCDGISDCDDGSDEFNCLNNVCSELQFRCDSGACIPKSWECDREYDCTDYSDEHCIMDICPDNFFKCNNGRCIDNKLYCDGTDNCGDNSDEKFEQCHYKHHHSCLMDEIACASNTSICIPLSAQCNGVSDCPKHEDEADCSKCLPNEFKCKSSKFNDCIMRQWLCDGYNDCGDNSDEDAEMCSHKNAVLFQTEVATPCKNGFRCTTGTCINMTSVCNGVHDCYDGSDENGQCTGACEGVRNPCNHICQKTPKGPTCTCKPGYKLLSNGFTCVDDNECEADPPICSQLCHNYEGGYNCDCYNGFMLRTDKKSCKAEGSSVIIHFVVHNSLILELSAKNNSIGVVFAAPMLKITGLASLRDPQLIFFSVEDNEAIYKVDPSTDTMHYIRNVGLPQKIAIDWSTQNIYYYNAEPMMKSISVCSFEEKCAKLIDIDHHKQVSALAVDAVNKVLFYVVRSWWVLDSPSYVIYKTFLDGSNKTELVKTTIGNVEDITINLNKKLLYFQDEQSKTISVVSYNGGPVRPLFYNVSMIEGMNFYEDSLYYLREDGHVVKCDLYGSATCKIRFKLHNLGSNLFVINQQSLQPNVDNVCKGHTCAYLCISGEKSYKCLCHNGSLSLESGACGVPENPEDLNKFKVKSVVLNNNSLSKKNSAAIASAIVIPLLLIGIFGMFVYILKKRADGDLNLSIKFYNPVYGKPVDDQKPILQPGQHEYSNPINRDDDAAMESINAAVLNRPPIDLC